MSGCEGHLGQFDRTCCSGKGVKESKFVITNYFEQAALAEEIMREWLADHPEFDEEWEIWDWL